MLQKLLYNTSYYFFYYYTLLRDKLSNTYKYFFVKRIENGFYIKSITFHSKSHTKNVNISDTYFKNPTPLNLWDSLNPKPGDFITITYEVSLNNETNTYIIPYTYPANVVFPPYSLEEIMDFQNDVSFKNSILSAEVDFEDYMDGTEEMKKWAGPLGNFYSDKPFRKGNFVKTNMTPFEMVNIVSAEGEDYCFQGDGIITLDKVEIKNSEEILKKMSDELSDSSENDNNDEMTMSRVEGEVKEDVQEYLNK